MRVDSNSSRGANLTDPESTADHLRVYDKNETSTLTGDRKVVERPRGDARAGLATRVAGAQSARRARSAPRPPESGPWRERRGLAGSHVTGSLPISSPRAGVASFHVPDGGTAARHIQDAPGMPPDAAICHDLQPADRRTLRNRAIQKVRAIRNQQVTCLETVILREGIQRLGAPSTNASRHGA